MKLKKLLSLLVIALILNLIFNINHLPMPIADIDHAQASSLSGISDTLTRLKKNTVANHTIVFTTPSGVDDSDTITLTFASDFNVSSVVLGDVTIGGNAPGSVGVVGQVITITADADTTVAPAGTATIVIGNNHITNATTAGSYTVSIGGTFGDTGSFAIAIADQDQVTISGTVDPYLSFEVTDGTVSLGTLSITSMKSDTAAMTAATNAGSGYTITVNGATLTSGANTITAIGGTAAISAVGTEQFGFNIGASGGSGSAVAPYDDTATPKYAFDVSNVPDEVAHATGVSDTTTFTMTYMANIAATTEAGTYTATHTYICTGNF